MLALLLAVLAFGEPDPADHIVATDRPDFANSSLTVPRGGWQVELGVNVDVSPKRRPLPLGIPTTLRVGVTNRFELRLFDSESAEWIAPRGIVEPRTSFGGKLRLADEDVDRWTPAVALQPLLLLGLRRDLLPAAELTLIVSQPFGQRVMLDLNFAAEYELGDPLRRAWEGFLAASPGVQVNPRTLLYAELYVTGTPGFGPSLRWGTDGGAVVILTRHVAIDAAARIERYGRRTAAAVLTGLTVLLVAPCPLTGPPSKRAICRARPRRPQPVHRSDVVH